MQEAVPVGQGRMIAVLGSKIKDLSDLIKDAKINGICEIANDNAEGQTIISGETESIHSLQGILKSNNKKFIPLNVSAPFHCSLMKPAAKAMESKINATSFKKPNFKIVNNVTSQPEDDPIKIKKLLIDQICSTVKWRESIINMSKENVTKFIEIGPGKVLSGMVKRTLKNINCFSINSIDDMKKIQDEFKNKKVLITGATGGIGNSLVKKFCDSGSIVLATGTNQEKLDNIKKNYSDVIIERFKLDEHQKIESFIDQVHTKLNGIDILVNNAGINLDNISIRLTEENWKKVIDINLTATFFDV